MLVAHFVYVVWCVPLGQSVSAGMCVCLSLEMSGVSVCVCVCVCVCRLVVGLEL